MPKCLLILLLGLVIPASAQFYSATKAATPSSASVVVTVQQPANPVRSFFGSTVSVSSDTALTFKLERNGTAATQTALTPKAVNPSETAPETLAFSTSDVGVGTDLGDYQLPANGSVTIDLSKLYFQPSIKGQNLSIRTSSLSGNVTVIFVWQEKSL